MAKKQRTRKKLKILKVTDSELSANRNRLRAVFFCP